MLGAILNGTEIQSNSTDYVTSYQIPTAANNYTWYRKYKSGWVEQGGTYGGSQNQTISLPVEMADNKYSLMLSFSTTSGNAPVYSSYAYRDKTTTSFVAINSGSINGDWQVSGMSTSPEETTINLLNNLDDSSFDGFAKVGSNLVGTNTYVGSDVFRHAAVPFTTPNYACKLKIEGSCTVKDTEFSFLPTFLMSTAITPSNFETVFNNSGITLNDFIDQWGSVNDIFSLTQNPETDGYTIQEWLAYSTHMSSLTEAEWKEMCDNTFNGEFYYIPGNSYAKRTFLVAIKDIDVMGSYYSNCLNIMPTYDEQQPGLINYEQVLSPNTSYVLNFLSGFEASDTYQTNIEINKLEITKI